MTDDVDGEFFEQPAGLRQANGDVRLSVEQGVDGGKAGVVIWSAVNRERPATATVGMPRRAAAAATPTGAFPLRLCSSRLPSPVTTSAAPVRRSSKSYEVQNEFDAGTHGGVQEG